MAAPSPIDARDFLDHLKQAIGARAKGGGPVQRAYERVAAALPDKVEIDTTRSTRHPACAHLETCYANLEAADQPVRRLAASFRALEPALPWARSARASAAPLAETYAGALIVGRGGAMESDRLQIGVSLMAPGITFPDHQHPPEEVYIALSQGEWRQNADPWVEPGIGGLIYNPPNIVHAMRSGREPFLAVWCLPLG